MILRCVFRSIFLCLAIESIVKAQVTVDDQGYQNVLISFEPNVPSKDGIDIIAEIQNLLQNTSGILQRAIGIPIASATFRLPPSWPTDEWKNITITPATSEQAARRSDITIDGAEDSPFIKQPVALQHAGCGVPGHQIILNLKFIGVFPKYSEGKLFAREWLKYRYGVFEENGFTEDLLYPAYYRIPGKPEIRINECTDSKVTYTFKTPLRQEECDVKGGLFGFCRAHPDEKSAANVTSSLMYFNKDIPNMEHICGKDGFPHHSTSPNKQNTLCDGRSIWDVIKLSEDFKNVQPQTGNPVPRHIQFSYVQERKPRLVVLLEDTDNLIKKEIPSAIQFALRRFYYDLPQHSKLAIYTYKNDVTEVLPSTDLPSAEDRADLGPLADFGSPANSICASCALLWTTRIMLEDSEVDKDSILLITASPLDKVPDLPKKLLDSGICLHVLRFTDNNTLIDPGYGKLANSFACFSQKSLRTSLDTISVLHALSTFLKSPVPEIKEDFEIKTVASGSMSAQTPLKIPRDETAELYTLWLGRALGSSSVECKAGDTVVELKPHIRGTEITSFTLSPADVDISCSLRSTKQQPAQSQVQMKTKKGHYFDFDVWIHDVSTDKEQLPIIVYAKIYFGGYPVKNANVTAVVTFEKNQEKLKMLDNGQGDPDVTQNDGIYSGYFTSFLEAGRYNIAVKINDNQRQAKIGKDSEAEEPDGCCGSEITSKDAGAPAFELNKSIVYIAKNKRPEDGYPPSRILNLQAQIFRLTDDVILTWTTPRGGKAVGYEIKLFENKDDAATNFDTTGRKLNTSSVVPKDTGEFQGFVIPFKDLDGDKTYFAAIRSRNEFNKKSEVSNLAEFVPKQYEDVSTSSTETSPTPESTTHDGITNRDPPKKGNHTVAIVLGVLGGIAVVCVIAYLGYYFFVKKPRRN